jgi:hypothetical protein
MRTPIKLSPARSSSRSLKVDEKKESKITIRPKELDSIMTMEALDVDEILEKICDGKQNIVTFKGSSQYGDKLGNRVSASTCGLAALNFARTAFRLEKEECMQGLELLSELLSPKTTEVRGIFSYSTVCSLSSNVGNHFNLRLLEKQFSPGNRRAFEGSYFPEYPVFADMHL